MWLFYIIALFPITIGLGLFAFDKKIVWWEWAIGSASAFLLAGIFHICVIHGMTADVETWSGTVVGVERTPYWHAHWTEVKTRTVTDSKGKSHTETYTEEEYRSYPPTYSVSTTIGSFSIGVDKYSELQQKFGGREDSHPGSRPHFDSGDRLDYNLVNTKQWQEPVHDTHSWSNRVKAAPSVFSYKPVPKNAPVFEYPKNDNLFVSNRILGPNAISTFDWDQMNARLGATYKVNVILVNLGDESSMDDAQLQEAKWIGGKKNDMVLCYGGKPGQIARWSYVFSWSESDLCKKNIETLMLKYQVNNKLISYIENEIATNYKIKDWSKFDYLTIEVPVSSYIWYLIILMLTQAGLYIFFHFEDVRQRTKRNYYD